MILNFRNLKAFENSENFNIVVESLVGFQNHKIQENFIAFKILRRNFK